MATAQSSASLPFSSGEYSGDKLKLFTICFIPLQIICVVLRYYARYLTQGTWGLDDVLVLTSLMAQLSMAGISLGSIKNGGVGYHIIYLEETDPYRVTMWRKYLLAISLVYAGSFNLAKLAILALYRRLFPQKKIVILIHVLMGILVGHTISIVVAALAACSPFAANWYPTLPGAFCINKEALFIWSSFPGIVTDIVMLILPIRVVWNLQISKRLKVGLTITFMVGSLGFVTAIIRFATFFQKNAFIDGSWSSVDLMIWTQIETGIYLLSACLPTYRPLLECIGKKSFAFMSTYRSGSDRYNIPENPRNDYPSIPLNSVSKNHHVGNSSLGSSHVEDTPGADPRILVTTEIQMKWNGDGV